MEDWDAPFLKNRGLYIPQFDICNNVLKIPPWHISASFKEHCGSSNMDAVNCQTRFYLNVLLNGGEIPGHVLP